MEFCTRISNQLMLKEIEKHNDRNTVSSPLSINLVLNMVVAGSKGRSLQYMLDFLGSKNIDEINFRSSEMMAVAAVGGSPNNTENDSTVVMVNGVWVDKCILLRPSYEEFIRGIHKCEVKTVDILNKVRQVENEVNSWASVASRGLIKEILRPESLSRDTSIILANGLYFSYKFDASRTYKRDFHLSKGRTVLVPFMSSHRRYYFGSFLGFKVLGIPCLNQKLNMYFFLPNEKCGLKNLVEEFNTNPRFLQQNLNLREVKLDQFWIPKFKFSSDFDVSRVMEDMRVPLSFLENPKDWSDMIDIPARVSFMDTKMFQKACIEVDEKPNSSAGMDLELPSMLMPTRKVLGASSMPGQKTASFIADHPFMFMIKEETSGSVFFSGAVLNPISGELFLEREW
ncbi:serpin-Z10-like [Rhododendron vialii]|uniref:serpin-Z10-like n=1 Tax=Rhododendron vialii TaxID=182163 RepID=UPI00265EB430|nr:serpin-Z10-like [Rhododendron vialii]